MSLGVECDILTCASVKVHGRGLMCVRTSRFEATPRPRGGFDLPKSNDIVHLYNSDIVLILHDPLLIAENTDIQIMSVGREMKGNLATCMEWYRLRVERRYSTGTGELYRDNGMSKDERNQHVNAYLPKHETRSPC